MNKKLDIKNIKTAKRYAQALSQGVVDNIDEINEDLALVEEVIFNNPDFVNFFSHPIVSLKDKKDAINDVLNGKINEKTLSFLNILLDENRFNIFETIYEAFKQEVDVVKNRQRVYVTSAIVLDGSEKERLQKKLNEKLQKEVIINYEEDKDILGGLLIKFEDKVIDLSLKTKFNNLRKNI
ncbi:MAG: ATP synthase F1 subunit delta [Candidatus Gastranaerophilales bacterium]|nr:ATP synthase F1 subunit delta [Candidatus Gastranaerophilales bacterium]